MMENNAQLSFFEEIGEENILSQKLKPIIKWPGGKEKELGQIKFYAPKEYENYYEPFVGGGAVFTAFDAKHLYINDKSKELINLYRYIRSRDKYFFEWIEFIIEAWDNILLFVEKNRHLCELYKQYRNGEIGDDNLKGQIGNFVYAEYDELIDVLPTELRLNEDRFIKEVKKSIVHKMMRMKRIETVRNVMPEGDIYDNIETSFTGAMYFYFREMYNDECVKYQTELSTALFVFLRNYAYSGMFRYNDKGCFNVPYGGISYNHKSLRPKVNMYLSLSLEKHLSKTTIDSLDFEDFLYYYQPTEKDFIFLDPPYDSEFSTYAQNEFGQDDQRRLADYLCNECKAKWMMVIKNTPFIQSLYNREGIEIKSFNKKYTVSFMNRNEKNVEHLVIMNYKNM